LLETVLSNCTFDRGTLSPTCSSPFDLLVKGNETGNWRRGRDSFPDRVLIPKNLADFKILQIRYIRSNALVETRIEHADQDYRIWYAWPMKAAKPRLTKAQIVRTLRKEDEALKRYSVKRLGLFGSFARGEQTARSDIDFVVEFERPTYDNFYDLSQFLEKLFKRKVEVLTPSAVASIRVDEVARSIRESVIYV